MTVIIDGYKDTDLGLLPVEWAVENLDSICDILDSKRKPIKAADRSSGEYPYYGASGIIDWVTDYLFDEDLILLGEDGENIVSRNLPLAFRVSGKCWINNHAHVFRISDNNRDSVDFITMVLEAKDYSKLVVGSAQPKITQEQCKKLRLQRPPLPEQQKIADILTTVDDHISESEALIEKTKVLKQGLMQQLLTKGIGHTEFKDTEIGRIPVKWKVFKLENVAKINKKSLPNSTLDSLLIDYIDIESVSPGKINKYSTVKFGSAPSRARRVLSIGDTIVSTVRPYLRAIAYISQLKENTLICSTGFASVSPFGINPQFAYQFILSDVFLDQLKVKMVGSNYPAVNSSDVCESLVPIPPLPEQRQIAVILTSVDDQIDTYQAKLASLTRLKTGLMQQLLTGKIRVTV